MTDPHATSTSPAPIRPAALFALIAIVGVVALVLAAAVVTATLLGRTVAGAPFAGMGVGYGPGGGMMGRGFGPGIAGTDDARPGDPGFVAGTIASPRIITVIAGPGYTFSPAEITVERGETVTFQVTTMGPLVHEFMVGPADAVAADAGGTPEVADIGMMQTASLTYTFSGSGPYAFACHADNHYEAGMRGEITVVD